MEAEYGAIEGVIRTRVGYSGGKAVGPSYYEIKDHAETLQIEFDPSVRFFFKYSSILRVFFLLKIVSYEELVRTFFRSCSDTTPRGGQYRSAIFYHNPDQLEIAKRIKEEAEIKRKTKLYASLEPVGNFYLAEDYHQKYYLQNKTKLMKLCGLDKLPIAEFIASPIASRLNGFIDGQGNLATLKKELPQYALSPVAIKELESEIGKPLLD